MNHVLHVLSNCINVSVSMMVLDSTVQQSLTATASSGLLTSCHVTATLLPRCEVDVCME